MAKAVDKAFIGRWRITEMDAWDQDFIDLMVEGFIRFDKQRQGEFCFGAVEGFLDWRVENSGGKQRAEFTWDGSDEMDPANGRGWAEVDGQDLIGHIYFHLGENSGFKAQKKGLDHVEHRQIAQG